MQPDADRFLVTAHAEELRASAIDPAFARDRAGLYSSTDREWLYRTTGHRFHDEHLPALAIPYFVPGSADPVLHRVKPARPFIVGAKARKYVQPPGAGVRLYFPPGLLADEALRRDTSRPLVVTEGEKKAIAIELAGYAAIGIGGVWNAYRRKLTADEAHTLAADFEHVALRGRVVVVCFDSDATSNKQVRAALDRFATALERAHAEPRIAVLPADGGKVGADDFIRAHGRDAFARVVADARPIRDVIRPARAASRARAGEPPPAEGATDLANAERFARDHGADVRYCAAMREWFEWNGARWARDDGRAAVTRRASATARGIYAEAAKLAGEQRANGAGLDAGDLAEWARKSEGRDRIGAIVSLAQSHTGIAVCAGAFDALPWALNTPSGLVDLRDGIRASHDRAALCTRITRAPFDPAAAAPRFLRFLEEVQPDPEVRAYLARLFGYAALGVVREHVIAVLWGPGANGKSVLADVVSHVLGDYARPGPSSLLVSQGASPTHPTDIASLIGSRLVIVHETARGARFDAAKVKLLTGGDQLTARYMRGDFIDFTPVHTLVMLSNYRPQVDASDGGLWRRVQLVPFRTVIPEERQDRGLAESIKADEAAGVLRWLVDGAREWHAKGLAPPAAVRDETARYRAAEDSIGRFIEERCAIVTAARVSASDLFAAFRSWASDVGEPERSQREFGEELSARGFERKPLRGRVFYQGIGIAARDEHADRMAS